MKRYKIFDKETTLIFCVMPPIYRPYFNVWGQNLYSTYEPFCEDPFCIDASSTSGAPVILCGNKFFGFMNQTGGSFAYDGAFRLTVTCPAGQGLWINEDCDPYGEWRAYNEEVLRSLPPSQSNRDFWSGLEYCTWVDQKRRAHDIGCSSVHRVLTAEYVYEYMRRVDKMNYPRGKLTIDDGWDLRKSSAEDRPCYGNWRVDREKFPDMPLLVRDIKSEGFIPGLWFAPFTVTENCEFAQKHPHLLGKFFPGDSELPTSRALRFLRPYDEESLEEYYRGIFAPYAEMGFMKFKMDMSYGNKNEMQELARIMRKVIKSLDPDIEIEGHIADIFTSRYFDTVRINDVNFGNKDWRGVTAEHYKVSAFSSHDKILNFDHIGTNSICPTKENYLSHAKMICRMKGGYPCVSLLPDVFDGDAVEVLRAELEGWEQERKKPDFKYF